MLDTVMRQNGIRLKWFTVLTLLLSGFLVSCAPKLTFFVTKPPLLPVESIDTISIGSFSNVLDQEIGLPAELDSSSLNTSQSFTPAITSYKSNQNAADLVRAITVSGLSTSNQYRILGTGNSDVTFSGIIPNAAKTGVISAKVRYFEKINQAAEDHYFTLLATKGGGSIQEQLAMLAAKETSSTIASRQKKGFHVPVPYIEIVSAMEVAFDMVRDSDGQTLIPTQVFRSYYVHKWGGSSDRSHLAEPLRQIISSHYQEEESTMERLKTELSKVELAVVDPDEFLAKGGKLRYDLSVPRNSLEIRNRLAQEIVDQFLRNISSHTVETTLEVASGDATAVTYIKANAYELAINRLESIERSVGDSFNLGLAYESIGEYRQALVYYQQALDQDAENETYKQAVSRVRR